MKNHILIRRFLCWSISMDWKQRDDQEPDRDHSYYLYVDNRLVSTVGDKGDILCTNLPIHNFILGYHYNRFPCFDAQKVHTFSHTVKCCSTILPHQSDRLCFSSCLFKAPPPEYPVCSEWSAHICLRHHRYPCFQLLCCVYSFLLASSLPWICINYVWDGDGMMSKSLLILLLMRSSCWHEL